MIRNCVLWLVMLGLSSLAILIIAELSMRMIGHQPTTFRSYINEPRFFEYDPLLGWRNKPGIYNYAAYTRGEANIDMSILSDGQRITSKNTEINGPPTSSVLMIGCSYTFGFAVSDQDTFAWKIQTKNPKVRILNYGSNAYGTYQSLLKLKQVLPQIKMPKKIIYGFIQNHEIRNVGAHSWLKLLSAFDNSTKRGSVQLPYVSLDSQQNLLHLKSNKPMILPLRDKLAIVAYLEDLYMKFRDKNHEKFRIDNKTVITERLIQQMHNLSKLYGAEFYVVILDALPESKLHYTTGLPNQGINVVDCTDPDNMKLRVLGEGHPNAQLHTNWADCINQKINFK